MDSNRLLIEYQNLSDRERIKFDLMYLKNKEKQQKQDKKVREDAFNNLKDIKDKDGNLYFDKQWLEKNIK